MKDPIVLIIAGHGGIDVLGKYSTPGKRSPQVPPGVFEGENNRTAAEAIERKLKQNGIRAQFINPGPLSIPVKTAIGYTADIVKRGAPDPVFLLEIHANSDTVQYFDARGWTEARGHVMFTGEPPASDPATLKKFATAKAIALAISQNLTGSGSKIPNRGTKTAPFTLISRAACPAVLIERGFMSNFEDAKLLQSPEELEKLSEAIAKTIAAL
jgi:N-acetylmuramoyl-L-alanine amidase